MIQTKGRKPYEIYENKTGNSLSVKVSVWEFPNSGPKYLNVQVSRKFYLSLSKNLSSFT